MVTTSEDLKPGENIVDFSPHGIVEYSDGSGTGGDAFSPGSFPTSFRTGTQKIAIRRKENSMTNSFRLTDSPLLPPCLLRSALWRLLRFLALCRSLEPQLATDACTKNMRPRLLRQPRFQYVFRQRR